LISKERKGGKNSFKIREAVIASFSHTKKQEREKEKKFACIIVMNAKEKGEGSGRSSIPGRA